MKLFQAIHPADGESYVRRYIWTTDKDRAAQLLESYGQKWQDPDICIEELFDASAPEFVSEDSDSGFDMPDHMRTPDSR